MRLKINRFSHSYELWMEGRKYAKVFYYGKLETACCIWAKLRKDFPQREVQSTSLTPDDLPEIENNIDKFISGLSKGDIVVFVDYALNKKCMHKIALSLESPEQFLIHFS